MSPAKAKGPSTKVRSFIRGVGEVGAFVRECAVAVFEICLGRWPQPVGARRRKPEPPDEGLGPIEKVAPFPSQD